MTWIVPLSLAALLAGSLAFGRRQPGERLRRRIADDPETGRTMVRSGRGAAWRIVSIFAVGSFALSGASLLVRGRPEGLAWLLVAVLMVLSRRETRRMQARVADLLEEEVPTTTQDRIRDRFSTAYIAVGLASFSISRLLVGDSFGDEPTWRLAVGSALLGLAVVAGLGAMWSQAWVFSEERWAASANGSAGDGA